MLNKNNKSGFTIVELLVVIVVIGILAAITIVSYSGISKKAIAASLQSDLDNNSKQLKLYNVEYGYYPSTLDENYCPSTPTADTRYCLKHSTDTVLAYIGGNQAFTLTATKNSASYEITENSAPYSAVSAPITAMAAITGTPQIAQTLTAGALTPASATVTYQWQSATTLGGTYTNIAGATDNTYVLVGSDLLKHFKVVATGTGRYTGSLTSTAATAIDSNWLTIGAQTWASANANAGTMITATTTQTNNATLEKYCYGNNSANCTTYGGIYQWGEAMQYANSEGAQGICPAGSHIPSDNDWKILEVQVGMTQTQANLDAAWRGTDEGTKLKSSGSSGMNILLAGLRDNTGTWSGLSTLTNLWSSSESGSNAWRRHFEPGYTTIYRSTYDKVYGFSVRCIDN